MDQFYNVEVAKTILQREIEHPADQELQILTYHENEPLLQALLVCKTLRPPCWRLLSTDSDEGQEEIVFRLQGIISRCNLPPIFGEGPLHISQAGYLRQSVQVTGLGSESFINTIQAIQQLDYQISRKVSGYIFEHWRPSQFDKFPSIDVANRYFMKRADVVMENIITFPPEVDPNGVLGQSGGDGYVHTVDNEVLYSKRTIENGETEFSDVNPSVFRIGDVVELQLSLVGVQLRGKRVKMIPTLRSIALLDSSPVQLAVDARNAHYLKSVSRVSARPLKRKVGYDRKDPVEETRKRYKKLEINETDNRNKSTEMDSRQD